MSFGINGPDNHIPAIQKSHKSNDGGAGNLGYFQQERKKKEEKEENDILELSSSGDKEDPLAVELDSIGTKIKNFWLKINNSLITEKSEEK